MQVPDLRSVHIRTSNGDSLFKLTANEHINTLRDEDVLYFIVLAYNYSLCECYARSNIDLRERERLNGGIEKWGTDLLA